jgi:biotin carboxylase
MPGDRDVRAASAAIPYPCIVKPLGLSGSRGVIRADTPAQFQDAVVRIRALLSRPDLGAQRTGLTGQLLIEGYIEGKEYAVEGLLTQGAFRMLALFDKPDPLEGPYFEETIYVTPSHAPEHLQQAIATEVQRATTALGLVQGPVHAECRVGPAGITMLEVAARPIGGLCSKALRFESGGGVVPLEEVLLRHALGEDVSACVRERLAAGVMMIPVPRRGIYKGVRGDGSAREVEYVEDVRMTAKTDQLLEPLPEGDSYLGFIFARGARPAEVVAALREAHGRLAFEIDPELRVIRL